MFYALLMAVEYLNLTTQKPQESQWRTQTSDPLHRRISAPINPPHPTCPQSIKCMAGMCVRVCVWAPYNQCVRVCVSVCICKNGKRSVRQTHATATPTQPNPLPRNNQQPATGNNLKDTKRNRKVELEQELVPLPVTVTRTWPCLSCVCSFINATTSA